MENPLLFAFSSDVAVANYIASSGSVIHSWSQSIEFSCIHNTLYLQFIEHGTSVMKG